MPRKNANKTGLTKKSYTDAARLKALQVFAHTGSVTQTSRSEKIPVQTLESWRKTAWWKEKLQEVRNGEDDVLDAKLTSAVDKSVDEVLDRIENGETMYDPHTGELRRVPAKLRDLTQAMNSVIDKRQLIRKQPTKIIQQASSAAQLQQLAEQFATFVTGKVAPENVPPTLDLEQDEDGVFTIEEESNALHEES